MYSRNSTIDLNFILACSDVVNDVLNRNKIEWIDDNAPDGYREGDIRGFADNSGDIRDSLVRVTVGIGDIDVPFLDLVNAKNGGGYAKLSHRKSSANNILGSTRKHSNDTLF